MSQKERIKKALGISIYPWSSDEESNSDEPPTQATEENMEQERPLEQSNTGSVLPNVTSSDGADARTDPESIRLRSTYWKMLNQSRQTNRRGRIELCRLRLNPSIPTMERMFAIDRVSALNRLGTALANNVLEIESSSDDNEPQDNATAGSSSRTTRRGARGVMLAGTSQEAMEVERPRLQQCSTFSPGEGDQHEARTVEVNENEAATTERQAAATSPQSEGQDQSENEEDSDEENAGQAGSTEANSGVEGAGASAGAAEEEPREANAEDNEEDNNASNNSDSELRRRRKRRRIVSQGITLALRKFNEKFLRVLECPVCLECMAPPLRQCGRGHLLCSRCCSRLSSCPICRTELSAVRNRAMEAVAELLKYPCRHGCGQARRLKHRQAHEANCPARIYKCPASPCTESTSVTLANLSMHLQTCHPTMVKRSPRHTMRVPMDQEHRENTVLMVGPQLFHIRLDSLQRRGLHVHVAYLGPVSRAKYFAYEVSVEGEQMRKLVYTRVTHSDLECSSLILRRQDCFYLPLAQASNYIRSQQRAGEADPGHLELTVQVLVNEQRCRTADGSES